MPDAHNILEMAGRSNVLVAPILIPMIGAALCVALGRFIRAQRFVAIVCDAALAALAFYLLSRVRAEGFLVLRTGDWPGNQGIVFTLDILGAIMLCLTTVVHLVNILYARYGAANRMEEKFLFYPLFLLLGAGVNWAFITGDLFNLFVSFEIILICSYVLVAHGSRPRQMRESLKFVVMNIVASTLFLSAAGLTYGQLGTLNFADLALRIREMDAASRASIVTPLGTMFVIVFASKAALFPLFFWLPYAYPRASIAVIPYFAGLLTKVGVYALFRVITLLFCYDQAWFQPLLLAIASTSMIIGVLCALSRMSMRSILAFHIISQIGYMIFGLGLGGAVGLAAGIFYMVHHIIVKSGLFFVSGCVVKLEGTDDLRKLGGVADREAMLGIAFIVFAFSLAGIPPLSGFYGKYALMVEGFSRGPWIWTVVAISIITSLLTLLSMAKIWRYGFWGTPHQKEARVKTTAAPGGRIPTMVWPVAGLAVVSLLVAVFSPWVMQVARESSAQLNDPNQYITAVLGEHPRQNLITVDASDTAVGGHDKAGAHAGEEHH